MSEKRAGNYNERHYTQEELWLDRGGATRGSSVAKV